MMKSHFLSSFFVGNRRRLRELFPGTAPIIIPANGLLQRGADSAFRFSQDANFWYLTGIDEPDLVLVMDRGDEYLLVPGRSSSRQAFDGAIDERALRQRSGVKTVLSAEAGWELLAKRLTKVKHIATVGVPPGYIETYGFYTNPARAALVARLKQGNSELEIIELTAQLARLRMIKQAPEVAALQRAIDITLQAFQQATDNTKLVKYKYEYELEAELSKEFRSRGAAGHAFDPIVAAGADACTLHHIANQGNMKRGDLVVIDVGAEVEHYGADITRTLSLGKASRRQQAVYQAVLETQQFAIDQLKPGVQLKEYEQAVAHLLGEKLQRLGLIKEMTHAEIRRYCPHATSHFLGLNVHDIGNYEQPLAAGMVLTVEPGIYIPEEGIGVRIEDDVLITAEGNRVLSETLPRTL